MNLRFILKNLFLKILWVEYRLGGRNALRSVWCIMKILCYLTIILFLPCLKLTHFNIVSFRKDKMRSINAYLSYSSNLMSVYDLLSFNDRRYFEHRVGWKIRLCWNHIYTSFLRIQCCQIKWLSIARFVLSLCRLARNKTLLDPL